MTVSMNLRQACINLPSIDEIAITTRVLGCNSLHMLPMTPGTMKCETFARSEYGIHEQIHILDVIAREEALYRADSPPVPLLHFHSRASHIKESYSETITCLFLRKEVVRYCLVFDSKTH